MQIKFGLPIMKKPSSVLQYNDNLVAYGAASLHGITVHLKLDA